jgi:hypothetical protein
MSINYESSPLHMPKLPNADSGVCVPFRIAPWVDASAGVFGGSSPVDVEPFQAGAQMEHLFTLRWLHEGFALTCFVNSDFDVILDQRGRVVPLPASAIVVSVHSSLGESGSTRCASRYSRCAMLLDLPIPEVAAAPQNMIWNHHKIGGEPYVMGTKQQDEVSRARKDGLHQVVQLAFPDARDVLLAGDWPFGEDNFHLLADVNLTRFAFLVGR